MPPIIFFGFLLHCCPATMIHIIFSPAMGLYCAILYILCHYVYIAPLLILYHYVYSILLLTHHTTICHHYIYALPLLSRKGAEKGKGKRKKENSFSDGTHQNIRKYFRTPTNAPIRTDGRKGRREKRKEKRKRKIDGTHQKN